MRRQLGLPACALLILASSAQALPYPPPPPEPPPPMRVEVKSGEGNQSMVFVTSGGEGSHALKLRSQDGKVIVEADADPDRPWMGVLLDDSKAMDGTAPGTAPGAADGERSLEVLSVAEDSPAARGGLRKGDAITGIDGQTLAQRGGRPLFEGHRPGDRVKLDVSRDGKRIQVPIQLASRPGRVEFEEAEGMNAFAFAGDSMQGLAGLEALASLKGLSRIPCPEGAKCPTGFMFETGAPPRLGVIVDEMSEQLARFFGTEPGKGMLVKEVVKDSAAEKAGLEAGDVILRVGRTDVGDASDISDALDAVATGGEVEIEVLRRGEHRILKATLPEAARRGSLDSLEFAMPEQRELERSQADVERQVRETNADVKRQVHEANADVVRELERVREQLREESKHRTTPSRTERPRGSSPSATHGAFQRAPGSPASSRSTYIAQ